MGAELSATGLGRNRTVVYIYWELIEAVEMLDMRERHTGGRVLSVLLENNAR